MRHISVCHARRDEASKPIPPTFCAPRIAARISRTYHRPELLLLRQPSIQESRVTLGPGAAKQSLPHLIAVASSLPSNYWLLSPPFMSFEAPDRSRCSSQPPPPIDLQSPSPSKHWPPACRICGPPLQFAASELPPPPLAPAPNPQPNSLQLAASGLSVARSLRTVCSSQPPSCCHRRVQLR